MMFIPDVTLQCCNPAAYLIQFNTPTTATKGSPNPDCFRSAYRSELRSRPLPMALLTSVPQSLKRNDPNVNPNNLQFHYLYDTLF